LKNGVPYRDGLRMKHDIMGDLHMSLVMLYVLLFEEKLKTVRLPFNKIIFMCGRYAQTQR